MSYYLADGGHVLISGSTGARDDYGGKSVLANWWSWELVQKGHRGVSIYINPKGHGFVRGETVSSLKGLKRGYAEGIRVFDYQAPHPNTVVHFAGSVDESVVVVFDEAQDYKDSEMLDWTLSQGGNLDSGSVRGLVVTQRPWNLSEMLRANMPVKIWVGPITSEGRNFFQSEQMKGVGEELASRGMDAYHWAVTDAGDLQEVNEPVPEEFAQ